MLLAGNLHSLIVVKLVVWVFECALFHIKRVRFLHLLIKVVYLLAFTNSNLLSEIDRVVRNTL